MLGLVQGKRQWRESVGPIADQICSVGAEWLLAGMPGASGDGGIGGVASVQWSRNTDQAIPIGDAAFARDALASQGIANGISGVCRCLRVRTRVGPIADGSAARSSAISRPFSASCTAAFTLPSHIGGATQIFSRDSGRPFWQNRSLVDLGAAARSTLGPWKRLFARHSGASTRWPLRL